MTWNDFALASGLRGTKVSASYGTPNLKVRGKLLTRLRLEDDKLVLAGVPADERDMLLEAAPHVFRVTRHYDGYPIVLARIATLDGVSLHSFLVRRWGEIAPKRFVAKFDPAL